MTMLYGVQIQFGMVHHNGKEAMRRLEVPEDMQKKYKLPALGGANSLPSKQYLD